MTRLIIDASVLVSAAVATTSSPPARVFAALDSGAVEAAVSDQLLDEVERALRAPYFAQRVTDEERAAYVVQIRRLSLIYPDSVTPDPVLRDQGDDYLVALARTAGADAIVTGDKDLLDHENLWPPALSPRAACERFRLP